MTPPVVANLRAVAIAGLVAASACAAPPAGERTTSTTQAYDPANLVQHPRVHLVLAGSTWVQPDMQYTAEATIDNVRDIANRRVFYDALQEYYAPDTSSHAGSFDEHVLYDTYPVSTDFGHGDLAASIGRVTPQLGTTTPNDVFIVIPDKVVNLPNDTADHGIVLGFHDDRNGIIANRLDTATLLHEIAEMITDPAVGTGVYPEIGDAPCNANLDATLDGMTAQSLMTKRGTCARIRGWANFGDADAINTTLGDRPWFRVPANASLAVFPRQSSGEKLSVAAVATDHTVMLRDFLGNGTWTAWRNVGGWLSRIAAVSTTARGLDLYGIGGNDAIWAYVSLFNQWWSVTDFPVADVAVTRGGDGVATLFALGTDGVIRYQSLVANRFPTTTSWQTLDGLPGAATQLAVVDAGGLLRVAAVVGDTWPVYVAREALVTFGANTMRYWESWQSVSPPTGGSQPGPHAESVQQVALALTPASSPGGERMALFVVDNLRVWRAFDSATDESALAATLALLPLPANVQKIAVANNADGRFGRGRGRLEVFAVDSYRRVLHTAQRSSFDGDWGATRSLGGSVWQLVGAPTDWGNLEVFGVGADAKPGAVLVHDYQVVPSGGWDYE